MRKAKLSFTSTWPNHVKKKHSISDLKRSTVQNIKADNKQGTAQRKCCKYPAYTCSIFVVWSLAYCLPHLYLVHLNGRVGIFNRGTYTETQKTVSFYINSLVPRCSLPFTLLWREYLSVTQILFYS